MRTRRTRDRIIGFGSMALLLLIQALPASGYSSVPGSCAATNFYPVHGNAQAGNGGFTLSTSSPTYTPGQLISITLSGTQSFKGLLLYVFDSVGNRRGTFQIPANYQSMDGCGGDASSTIGHASSLNKSVPVVFNWTAPTSTDPLTVVAVMMINASVFYVANPITVNPVVNDVDDAAAARAGISLSASPNPFTASTTIEYSLDREAPVSLRVYDINGRWVRSLDEGAQSAGVHTLAWDGRDDQGADLGMGVYFVRVDTGHGSGVRKLLRLQSPGAQR